ncbi:rhamnose ABC transporter substrate-binding protein [Paraburkholderia caballeronis]|uniref:Monosaccharide ABC transporter substrate-binding protein, CUT2 family n=1 Tax=Paraburkholderia caballeronis TaxID=416943 RepID=A0A1H7IX10_9BURK|nr:rhamnose ABC transporter substrate-binding protein [Paraburkholderia caballeronis]PXW27682.1 monosaccharide ABC transporter substrate-binding protein (CUT2 family) [Paraburkholderia caballeronis]PXX03156.1 monosaccharide ABC transporter substrate-binding protein (CUT2 family) [Paraburkholderia caballeronis]RAK03881.1 monosaccharide ABC transporter substrate-binding protein (CUT2 family) [Paraburkholderia caballeronis]TDV20939.1 monosaccharide ABC transporter substrate-binding protein (CUT2 f
MFKPVRGAGAALLCALLLGGTAAHAAGIKDGLKIAFVPKQINNPYEVIADNGGMAAIGEFKGVGKVVGPSDAGASSQVSYINTLTTQRQDVIVIAANDANALVPYLKRAMAQGIKVVTFDSDTAPEGRQVFVNQADAESIGRGQVQLVAKLMGGEGEFAILSATPNATNQNTWIRWMQEELKKPEYAKMKLVKIAYGNDDDQKSFVETQGLLQAYPNLKAIVAPTTVGIAAAARYISTSSSKGKVAVTGLGTPNQMRAFVKNGTVTAFQLWDPGQLGYLAAYAAANLASGTITGKEGDSFDAGKLGKRTVGKSGEVILGPPTTFDASNIDNFNF